MRQRPSLKQLAAEVRRRRKERHLSQEELAAAAGVNTNTVKRLEWGRSNCQIQTLFDIAVALDMPLSELIAGVERRS